MLQSVLNYFGLITKAEMEAAVKTAVEKRLQQFFADLDTVGVELSTAIDASAEYAASLYDEASRTDTEIQNLEERLAALRSHANDSRSDADAIQAAAGRLNP